ncbi:MAG: ribonuclease P protein component [Spirochaetia bacterium]|nr:ribonuclease P protein component [Spirochaetia bacterium]
MKQKVLFESLKSKTEISEVFEKGMKLYSANLLMRFLKKEERENTFPLRVLMAIPKKKLGAVRRNRLKRICKSSLFESLKKLDIINHKNLKYSFDVIIHARDSFENLSHSQRVLEFDGLAKRLIQ